MRLEKRPEVADILGGMPRIEELKDMFRRMPVALYRTSADGKILAANTALANLLGYDSVEAMMAGLTTVDSVYVDPRQRSRWIDEISEAGTVHELDVELKRPDGTTVWVQDTARAIRDAKGRIAYFEGALIDQTEKIKAQKTRDEFLATVSHELRNPIAVMLGMGEELANNYDAFSDEDRRDMAQLIARQADDASWLIEDLLVASRDDITKVAVFPQDFDMTKEAERVLEVSDQPIELEVRGEESSVHADPRRTRQIIRNLVSNAIRYGGDQNFIRIEPIGDRVELRVCDSGEMIPSQELERIFEAFETGTGKGHPKSVGLGLSVARKLARLMDGDLTYRHEGGYSCFVLSLPSVSDTRLLI
ncbi:MAG: PAS domain-containing sensor histidine kinase [Acidimicrobiia bacterium]